MNILAPVPDEREWLTDVLTRKIPLGGAMQMTIARLDDKGIELHAPLAPSINDKGTAFGGALVSQMILAGWSLPRLLLRRAKLDADLVIGRCEVRFLKPVEGDFGVRCDWPEAASLEAFIDQVRGRGRGKLELAPECVIDSEVAATLAARYAALENPTGSSGKDNGAARPDA
ncbi:MAG TPA: YiiD C-terminal domain-containing protein [Wenzhouxiangellaceae bacterium]|nr:YiiD C-terminal domain-containing protein [Wenzhouxiangellaceae bacterium]